jgi:cysteinyl-tRNA synthetase
VERLENDFNTPEALAVFHAWHSAGEAELLTRGLNVFGLPRPARLHKIHLVGHVAAAGDVTVDVIEGPRQGTREILEGRPALVHLFRRRLAARSRKDFGESDALRDQLRSEDVEVEDTPEGGRLVIRESG